MKKLWIILIVVAVALLIIFRNKITAFISHAITSINNTICDCWLFTLLVIAAIAIILVLIKYRNVIEVITSEGNRYIPSSIRIQVSVRDNGQCRYVTNLGIRCTNKSKLEFHHIKPVSRGGKTSIDNLILLCRYHHHKITKRMKQRHKI